MKNLKEEMSLETHYTIQYTVNGICWLLFSVFNLSEDKVMQIVAALFLTFGCICSIITVFKKHESDDEMSLKHIAKAKALAFDITGVTIMGIGVVSMISDSVLSYYKVYGFIFAASQILAGQLFRCYERMGDY